MSYGQIDNHKLYFMYIHFELQPVLPGNIKKRKTATQSIKKITDVFLSFVLFYYYSLLHSQIYQKQCCQISNKFLRCEVSLHNFAFYKNALLLLIKLHFF